MTHLKRLMLFFSALLLVSLACNTITGQGGNQGVIADNDNNQDMLEPLDITVEPSTSDDDAEPNQPVEDPEPTDQPAEDPELTDQPAAGVDNNGTIVSMGDAKGVEIIEMNWEQDSNGNITFIGLLENNSENELSFISLSFTLRDASGTPVATGNSYSSLDILQPGDISPFEMYFYEPPYDPWTSYEILIDADVNEFFTHYTDFEEVSAELEEDNFGFQIAGEVKNTGDQSSDFVAVYVIIYNSANEPIAVDFTFTEADVVAPGETDTFLIYIWDTFGDQAPDHFTLFIEGNLVSE